MFRQGDYEIVRMNGEEWELYNLKDDPTELKNLANKFPERVNELSRNYDDKMEKLKN
jgi:arylsulfatase